MYEDELAHLVASIHRRMPTAKILISTDAKGYAAIPPAVLAKDYVEGTKGECTMRELAALIENSLLYIGVDTGITHLAALLRARSLVIAHDGTPHWLPYYNENAVILYQIKDDASSVHKGRAYLASQRNGRVRYLDRVSREVIEEELRLMDIS